MDQEPDQTEDQDETRQYKHFPCVLMAVGTAERGDDGLAIHSAKLLEELDTEDNWLIIPCGIYPENYTATATRARPKTVVLLDAAEMGLEPGQVRIVGTLRLNTILLSTHRIPLSFLVDYLAKEVPEVVFIGVQPRSLEGVGLSPEVKAAAEDIAHSLSQQSYREFKVIK
jgi:hydrogenase 3 maturation protease